MRHRVECCQQFAILNHYGSKRSVHGSVCVHVWKLHAIPTLLQRNSGAPLRLVDPTRMACPHPGFIFGGASVEQLHRNGELAGDTICKAFAYKFGMESYGHELHWHSPSSESISECCMQAGAYAIVRCAGEMFLRCLHTEGAAYGRAGGHQGLAAEQPSLCW